MKDPVNATFPTAELPDAMLPDSEDESDASDDQSKNECEGIEEMSQDDIEDSDSDIQEPESRIKGTEKLLKNEKSKLSKHFLSSKLPDSIKETDPDDNVPVCLIDKESKFYDNDILAVRLVSKKWFLDPLYSLVTVLTIGLLNIVNNWSGKKLRNAIMYHNVEDLEKASHVAIDTSSGKKVHSKVQSRTLYISEQKQITAFVFMHNYQLYYFDNDKKLFQNIKELSISKSLVEFLHENKDGKDDTEAISLQETFGYNELILKKIKTNCRIFSILARPAASVKIFSIFILGYLHYKLYIWFVIGYLIYQLVSEIKSDKLVREELQKSYYQNEKVLVVRNSKDGMHKKKIMDARDLVPGDLIEITDSLSIPADVILVHGSCIVENNINSVKSITRTKLPVEKKKNCTLDKIPMKNVLVAGDRVIYTINHVNEGCFGIVLNTGFDTVRGATLRSIIRPKTPSSIYMRDAYMLFTLFTIIALITSLIMLINQKFFNHFVSLSAFMTQICQLTLVVLKPAVPMALFSATIYSINRLNKKNIRSNDPNKLNDMGKSTTLLVESDVFADEDVGTAGFLITNYSEDNSLVFDRMIKTPQKLIKSTENLVNAKKYIEACGLCHMVTKVHQNNYGSVLDINMLAASGFEVSYKVKDNGIIERYLESKQTGFSSSYKIIKYFEPSRSYPVTSVIVENDMGETFLYSKGEPFIFEKMCEKRSIPFSYSNMVAKCANKGFKCTAIGFTKVNNTDSLRTELESGLQFLGFFFSNTIIKEGIESTTTRLNDAEVDTILLTNDSVYLGLSYALNSGICSNTVYVARTMVVNNVETVVWQCTQRNKEASFSASMIETNNLVEIDLTSEDISKLNDASIALTGPAFRLLMDKPEPIKNAILANCKVYANLNSTDRALIYSSLKGLVGAEPIVYVTSDGADINLVRNADVSISVTPSSLSPIHSFSCLKGNVTSLIDIIQESRTSLFNRHKNFEFVCYFVVLQYFGLLLLFSKSTNYATAQVFFMDIMLLLAVSYFQSNLGPLKLTKEVPCRSILSRKFMSSTLTLTSYGIVFMWILMTLLWKTKFYKTPTALMNLSTNTPSDKHTFYDPFVVFIFFVYLNVRFIISNNTSILFSKKIFKHSGFLLYIVFLMFMPFALLFVKEIQSPNLQTALRAVFQIPNLHGFEMLVIVVSAIMLCGFYLIRWIEQKYIRNIGLDIPIKQDANVTISEPLKSTKNISIVDKSKSLIKKPSVIKNSGLAKSFVKKHTEFRDVKRDLSVSLDAGKIAKRSEKLKAVSRTRLEA